MGGSSLTPTPTLAARRPARHDEGPPRFTLQEASDQITGDYVASVADYDAVETEILATADMLSSGIVAQFPQRFA